MRFYLRAAIVLLCLVLSACGGGGSGGGSSGGSGNGGGGSNYSISLSVPSLSFDVQQDTASSSPKTVSVTFVGDGVVVGTLPGQTVPTWLSVSGPSTAAGGTTSVQVSVNSGSAPGQYSFTLRFATGKADGSQVVYADLPITATIHESFALVAGGGLTFQGLEGGTTATATGSTSLVINGENVSWHANATQPWIQLGQTSGTARGPLPFSISLNGIKAGDYSGQINVSDDISGKSTFAIVQLSVRTPNLTTSVKSLSFNVDATTTSNGTHADLALSDELLGQNANESFQWSLSVGSGTQVNPAQPVVQIAPTTGNTAGAATHVSVTLDPTKLNGMQTQTLQTLINISYKSAANPTLTNTLSIPVTVTVRLPRANVATPFILSASTPQRVSIIGNDFRDEDVSRLNVSGVTSPTLTRVSSQEITVDLPGLATGQYAIAFQNALGLTRSSAEISVQGPPSIGAGAIVSAGRKGRLVVDSSRGMLYAANPGTQQIERYQWNGTNWNALTTTSLPQIADITPARNGRELYASAATGYYSLDLTTGASVPTSLINIPTGGCGSNPASIISTELGGLMSSLTGNSCTLDGWFGDVLTYDPLGKWLLIQGELERTTSWSFFHAVPASSADGRYVVVGENGDSGGNFGVFDLRADTFVFLISPANGNNSSGFLTYALDVDGAGDVIVVNNVDVRTRAGTVMGHLPANRIARLSADGKKAYIYIHVDGGLGKIQVIDLTASIAPGGTFPVLNEVAVPFDMGDSPAEVSIPSRQPNFAMTLSSDGRFAFLSGTSRIVSIALP